MHGTCTGEKSLPKSPRKKVEIISKLATKYKIKIKLKENRGRKPNPMDQNGEQFLITYTNPRRKDCAYTGIFNGVRTYKSKRYLIWMLRDLLKILDGESKEYQYTFSQHYKFIQSRKEMVYLKDIPETSYLCEICENTALMAKSLSKLNKHHPKDPQTFDEACSCDFDNLDCMMGDFKKCTVKDSRPLFDEIADSRKSECEENESNTDKIDYKQWIRENWKIKKLPMSKSMLEFLPLWIKAVANLKKHIYRKRKQVMKIN